jgi:hypothetical protein
LEEDLVKVRRLGTLNSIKEEQKQRQQMEVSKQEGRMKERGGQRRNSVETANEKGGHMGNARRLEVCQEIANGMGAFRDNIANNVEIAMKRSIRKKNLMEVSGLGDRIEEKTSKIKYIAGTNGGGNGRAEERKGKVLRVVMDGGGNRRAVKKDKMIEEFCEVEDRFPSDWTAQMRLEAMKKEYRIIDPFEGLSNSDEIEVGWKEHGKIEKKYLTGVSGAFKGIKKAKIERRRENEDRSNKEVNIKGSNELRREDNVVKLNIRPTGAVVFQRLMAKATVDRACDMRVPAMMMLNMGVGYDVRKEKKSAENVKKALNGLMERYYDNRKKAEHRLITPQPNVEGDEEDDVELNPEEMANIIRKVDKMAIVTRKKYGVQVTGGWHQGEQQEEQGTSATGTDQRRTQPPNMERSQGVNATGNTIQKRCPAVVKQFWDMYKDTTKIGRANQVDCTDTFRLQMEKVDAVFDQLDDVTDEIRIFILMQLLDPGAMTVAKDMKEEIKTNYVALKAALLKELGDELNIMEMQNRMVNMRQTERQSVTEFYRLCRDPLHRIYNRTDFPNDEVRNSLIMQKFVSALYYQSTKAYLIGSGIELVAEACEKADKYEYNMKLCSQSNVNETREAEFISGMRESIAELKCLQMTKRNQMTKDTDNVNSYTPTNQYVAEASNAFGNDGYPKKDNGNCAECGAGQGHTSFCSLRRVMKGPSMAMLGPVKKEEDDIHAGYLRYCEYLKFRGRENVVFVVDRDTGEVMRASAMVKNEYMNKGMMEKLDAMQASLEAYEGRINNNRPESAVENNQTTAMGRNRIYSPEWIAGVGGR